MIDLTRRQFGSYAIAGGVTNSTWTTASGGEASSPGRETGTFQYDHRRSGYLPGASPPSTGLQVRWNQSISDNALSAPVVTRTGIYVGDADGTLYALDRNGGGIRWRWTGGEQIGPPTMVDDTLYASTGNTVVTAFDAADGTVRWRHPRREPRTELGTPTVVDDLIYAGSKDFSVYAFDRETGEVRWRFETDNEFVGPTATDGHHVYCGNNAGEVYALSADTGALVWEASRFWITGGMTLVDETVYGMNQSGELVAYDAAIGEETWQFLADDGLVWGAPAATSETIVFGEQGKSTASKGYQVYGVNVADGRQHWRRTFDEPIGTSMIIAGDTVLFLTAGGTVHALDIATGDQRWSHSFRPGINLELGDLRWTHSIQENIWSTPVALDGLVFVGDATGTLYAFEAERAAHWRDVGIGGGVLALLAGAAYAFWPRDPNASGPNESN